MSHIRHSTTEFLRCATLWTPQSTIIVNSPGEEERIQQRDLDRDGLAPYGQMENLVEDFDWTQTPLGPVSSWPQSLKTVVRILLTSRYAMWMGWGPDLTFLYNDTYGRVTLGRKHPWALGKPAREVWHEIWEEIEPRIQKVLETGQATWDEALLLFLERNGYAEETYHTFSYSPLHSDDEKVIGMLCVDGRSRSPKLIEPRQHSLRTSATNSVHRLP
jgi:hypothetical protein